MEEESLRNKYYRFLPVLFEIVKTLKHREFALLKSKIQSNNENEKKAFPVRCMKAFTLDFLFKNFERFDFYNRNFDLYYSIATFSDMPTFSWIPKERKKQQELFFGSQFEELWDGYDFVLDIDAKNLSVAYADSKRIKLIMDSFGLNYSIKFTGNRGFHFSIAYDKFFPANFTLNECVACAETIAENLKEKEGIDSIDDSIYQAERLWKVPYSVVGENVALPLSDYDFNYFDISKMKIENVLKKVLIKNRGLLEREGKKENVLGFIKYYGGVK